MDALIYAFILIPTIHNIIDTMSSGRDYVISISPPPSPGSSLDYTGIFHTPSARSDASSRLNDDLLGSDSIFNIGSLSPIPMMERQAFDTIDTAMVEYYNTPGIQSRMIRPYFLLELIACSCFQLLISSNAFTFAIVTPTSPSTTVGSIIFRSINLMYLGIITNIFTRPDTYKSLNVTIEYLAINAIVYEYSFIDVLKYLGIQVMSGIIISFIMIGIYYDIIRDLPTEVILTNILNIVRPYTFSYSYILVTGLLHLCLSISLTILIDSTASANAKSHSFCKVAAIYLCRSIFGIVSTPVGYISANMFLYIAVITSRSRFDLLDIHLLSTYMITIAVICFIYPLVAIQIKFVWGNKYRRYIEYKRC